MTATLSAPAPTLTESERVLELLAPLITSPDAPDAFMGRVYEYVGEGDPLGDEADQATEELEGLRLRDSLGIDVEAALAKVTTEWIETQVESAILQSTPERVLGEMAATGSAGDLIQTPPAPVAHLRVPALSLRPLIDAVNADARRLAHDPAQQKVRARALIAVDQHGRPRNPAVALQLAEELGERLLLERSGDLDDRRRRRLEELTRDHARRRRYAAAFVLATRQILDRQGSVSAPRDRKSVV